MRTNVPAFVTLLFELRRQRRSTMTSAAIYDIDIQWLISGGRGETEFMPTPCFANGYPAHGFVLAAEKFKKAPSYGSGHRTITAPAAKNDFLGKIEQVLETAIGSELIATLGLPRDSISNLG